MNLRNIALFSSPVNRKLISDLKEDKSYNVTEIPQLSTCATILNERQLEAVLNFQQFDWLIFTDIFTVEYFLEILKKADKDLFLLDETNICVLGEAVADRLRFEQIHADIICSMIDVNEVVTRLSEFIVDEFKTTEPKIMIINENLFEKDLSEKLSTKFSDIFELPIYEIVEKNDKSISILKAKFACETFDDFLFTAPEDFVYLQKFLPTKIFEVNLFQNYLAESELIYQTLQEFGANPKYFYRK